MGDPYQYPGTDVLQNKLCLKDRDDLEFVAANVSGMRQRSLDMLAAETIPSRHPVESEEFLKDLHRLLMGDLYDWAGKYRKVDVGISFDHVAYESWRTMPEKLGKVFEYIKDNESFKDWSFGNKVVALSLVYGNIKNLQPFRDGNTRTAILYTRFLGQNMGLGLDFALLNPETFGNAQVAARDNNYNPLVIQFAGIVCPLDEYSGSKLPTLDVRPDAPTLSEYIRNRFGSLDRTSLGKETTRQNVMSRQRPSDGPSR